jgi:hypothetical protein
LDVEQGALDAGPGQQTGHPRVVAALTLPIRPSLRSRTSAQARVQRTR